MFAEPVDYYNETETWKSDDNEDYENLQSGTKDISSSNKFVQCFCYHEFLILQLACYLNFLKSILVAWLKI